MTVIDYGLTGGEIRANVLLSQTKKKKKDFLFQRSQKRITVILVWINSALTATTSCCGSVLFFVVVLFCNLRLCFYDAPLHRGVSRRARSVCLTHHSNLLNTWGCRARSDEMHLSSHRLRLNSHPPPSHLPPHLCRG